MESGNGKWKVCCNYARPLEFFPQLIGRIFNPSPQRQKKE